MTHTWTVPFARFVIGGEVPRILAVRDVVVTEVDEPGRRETLTEPFKGQGTVSIGLSEAKLVGPVVKFDGNLGDLE